MKTAAVVCLLLLFPAFASSAEPPTPAPSPAPTPESAPTAAQPATPGPAPLELKLRDAVAQALERNLDLAVARITPQSDAQNIVEAEATFDSKVDASVNYSTDKQEPTSDFSALGSTSKYARVKYTDPLMIGGQWGVGLNYNENSSDYRSLSTSRFGLLSSYQQASLDLTYNQSLLRNFGLEINRTAIDQALNQQRISENTLRSRIFDIVEQVESSYWGLVGANRQWEVAKTSLDLAKDFLRQTKIKVEVGILAPIEITTAEAETASREQGVITAENAVRNAEDVLRALMRIPEDSPDWDRPIQTADQPSFAPLKVDVEQAINEALARRSEIAAAQLSIRNAELNQRYRQNQTKPDLAFNGAYTMLGNNYDYVPQEFTADAPVLVPCTGDPTQFCTVFESQTATTLVPHVQGRGTAFSEIATNQNNSWSATLLLSLPIRNRAAKAELVKAKLAVDQSRLQFESVKQQIRVDVRTAARNLETAVRQVGAARANVDLQRKKVDAEQKRYENGLSTAFQVLTFQNDLRTAESQEISAIVSYNNALTHLARVQGVLLDERGVDVKM